MGSAGTKHTYDPAIHNRRSIRLRGHDYAGRGVYFVTIRVADHRPLFGTVVNGRMALNDVGRTAAACWRAIPDHFPHAELDEWIVMPDHVHGIIVIRRDGGSGDGGRGEKSFAPTNPTQWPTRPECVVSGFLSPMERAVFDACLNHDIPTVRIMARGLPARFPLHVQRAIDDGRLLVMSPFDPMVDRFSAARAAWCNQYALYLANNVVIGQLNPDGMVACLIADLPNNTPTTVL